MITQAGPRVLQGHRYIVVTDVLGADELRRIRLIVNELVGAARGRPRMTRSTTSSPATRRTIRKCAASRRRTCTIRSSASWRAVRPCADPAGAARPGVRLHGSKLNVKAPHGGSAVEWHQDWAFYPHTNDDLLAVGVMLDDCAMENGPLLVLPGTHRGPVYDHHADGAFCGAIDPEATKLELRRRRTAIAPAGSMSFHHVRAGARLGAEHLQPAAPAPSVRVRRGRRLAADGRAQLGRVQQPHHRRRAEQRSRASYRRRCGCRCRRHRGKALSTRIRRRRNDAISRQKGPSGRKRPEPRPVRDTQPRMTRTTGGRR